jgi:hypothetical protein
MKRIGAVGLCLVAAFVCSAMIVASAQAANPEFGQCVAAKKGFYKDSSCTERDESKGKPKGKFEWQAGPQPTCVAVKKGFYKDSGCTERDESKGKPKGKFEKACAVNCSDFTTSSGPVAFYAYQPENEEEPALRQGTTLTGMGGTVTCSSSAGSGEITRAREERESITFSGCESSGQACNSTGEAAGTIADPKFVTVPVNLPGGRVGVIARVSGAGEIVIHCGSVEEIAEGETLGVLTGDQNVASNTSTETWEVTSPSEGVQKERIFLNSEGEELGGPGFRWETLIRGYEGEPAGIFVGTGLKAAESVTNEAAIEVKN